jgi:ABC-2 type transport system ATP-binding protein
MTGQAMTPPGVAARETPPEVTAAEMAAGAVTPDRTASAAVAVDRPGAVAPTVVRPTATAPPGDRTAEVIRTEGLTKTYRSGKDQKDVTAVDGLDLTVCRGEIFGLLGPNGAGKTTTVGMLTTRVIPTAGTATVNGVDVVADPARAKYFIGVVHQVNTLDRSLTVWENLFFHGRYYGMSAAASRTRSDELLERFRLTHRAGAQVRTLSGGMARRLMVARAVMHRPAVLFLDEPTASLDPQSRIALWEIVSELHAEGQTILLTTHYMEEADAFCNRVAIIDHGRILALDSPAALKHNAAAGRAPVASAKAWLAQLRALERSNEAPSANGKAAPDNAAVEAALIEVVNAAERHGLSLEDLRGQVTLESVFIDLTGRDLRE